MINNLGLYDIAIDFDKMFTHTTTNIYFKEDDINTAKIKAKLIKKDKPINLEDTTVIVKIETTVNTIGDNVTVVDAENGLIEYTFPTNALIEGVNFFEIILKKEGSVKVSPRMAYKVIDSIDEANIEAETNYPILITLIRDTQEALSKANEAINIANTTTAELTEIIENKVIEVEGRVSEKENEVDAFVSSAGTDIANKKKEVDKFVSDSRITIDNKIIDANKTINNVNLAKDQTEKVTQDANLKINEVNTAMDDFEDRFNKMSTSQTSNAELIDARGQSETLRKELERIEVTPFTNSNKVRMVAHRGLSARAPENTIPAYELAGQNGFWGAECDIIETLDGQFVLMHDDTVDRTTNGTGKVSDLTLAQIKALNVDYGSNILSYPGLKVPLMSEFLFTCKEYGMVPVIEVKSMGAGSAEKFMNEIRAWGMENQCVVISFNRQVMEDLRALSKNIILQPLMDLNKANIDYCASLGKNTHIDSHYNTVTKELVEYAHKCGVSVNCWTVDSESKKNELIAMGVDFISTNILKVNTDPLMNIGNTNKVPGATLSDLTYSSFNIISEGFMKSPRFKIGSYYTDYSYVDSHYGTNTPSRAYSIDLFKVSNPLCYIKFDETKFRAALHQFDENKMFVEDSGWYYNSGYYVMNSKCRYVVVFISKPDDSNITESDIAEFNTGFKLIDAPKEEYFSLKEFKIGSNLFDSEVTAARAFCLNAIPFKGRFNLELINRPADVKVTIRPFSNRGLSLQDKGWIDSSNKQVVRDDAIIGLLYVGLDSGFFTEDKFNKLREMKIKLSVD